MTFHQPLMSLAAELSSVSEGSPELDRRVAYAVGLGDPTSRMMFEEHGPEDRRCNWFPSSYTSDRSRAIDLLPEGRDWDSRAEGLTALEMCGLALEAREMGLRIRHVEETTSGRWLDGKEVKRSMSPAKAAALEKARTVQAAKQAQVDNIVNENGSGEGKRPQVAPR